MFRETEALVSEQSWYQGGGLRSRVVPYAIAKLVHDATQRGRFVDLESVWKAQTMPEPLRLALSVVCEPVNQIIVGAPGEVPNPLEWAKQQACWHRVQALDVSWPKGWFDTLLTKDDVKSSKKSATRAQYMWQGIEAQTAVVSAGHDFWRKAIAWANTRGLLSTMELDILGVAAAPGKLPSEKQSMKAVEALKKLYDEGFDQGKDIFGK